MMNAEHKKLIGLAVGVLGFVGLAVAGQMDEGNKADVDATHQRYCDNIALWNAEAARGIPEIERTGHDDWRGTASRYCKGSNIAR
ncbi:hypothetical protein ACT3R7_11910 [Halomonas sp. AOP43-A1-21]